MTQPEQNTSTLTESFATIFNGTKQEDDEGLLEYAKRFKQARDIIKTMVGDDILYKFVEHTKEYKDAQNSTEGTEMKERSLNWWITYIYLRNSDQKRYSILMKNLGCNILWEIISTRAQYQKLPMYRLTISGTQHMEPVTREKECKEKKIDKEMKCKTIQPL